MPRAGGGRRVFGSRARAAQDHRDRITALRPGADFATVGKMLGEAWKGEQQSVRLAYARQHAKLKEEYAAQLRAWRASRTSSLK